MTKLENKADMSHLFPHSTIFNQLTNKKNLASLLKQRVASKFTLHNVKKDKDTVKNKVLEALKEMYKETKEKYENIRSNEHHEQFTSQVGKVTNWLTEANIE